MESIGQSAAEGTDDRRLAEGVQRPLGIDLLNVQDNVPLMQDEWPRESGSSDDDDLATTSSDRTAALHQKIVDGQDDDCRLSSDYRPEGLTVGTPSHC